MAMRAAPEHIAYVALLNVGKSGKRDAMGVIDVTPGRASIRHEIGTPDSNWHGEYTCEEKYDNVVLDPFDPSFYIGAAFIPKRLDAAIFKIRDQRMAEKPED
jgi:hypothetical protein